MTDADDLAKLRVIADEIDRVREEAKLRTRELLRQRDEVIVALLDARTRPAGIPPAYGAVSEVARAANLSRQRVDGIRKIAEARRAGQRDRKS